jgi:putative transposase
MARLPRLYVPGQAQLVHSSFASPFLSHHEAAHPSTLDALVNWIRDETARRKVQVHGFSVSPSGVALLATPNDSLGLPQVMQALGRNLAAKFRMGSVFSGRYRSSLPEPGTWALPALIWIDKLVQRSQPLLDPETWRWSSCPTLTGASLQPLSWISFHKDYWSLGNTPFDRQARYRAMLLEGNSHTQNQAIQQAIQGQWVLGSQSFIDSLEPQANRRLQPGQRGRPRKKMNQDGA